MESFSERCPRCGEGRLRSWQELNEEEREVTRRLPNAFDYDKDERRTRHRWCALCWHEEKQGMRAEG